MAIHFTETENEYRWFLKGRINSYLHLKPGSFSKYVLPTFARSTPGFGDSAGNNAITHLSLLKLTFCGGVFCGGRQIIKATYEEL